MDRIPNFPSHGAPHYKAVILVGLGLWVYISLCSIEGACLQITEILRCEASAKYKTDIHVGLRWPLRSNSLILQLPFGLVRGPNMFYVLVNHMLEALHFFLSCYFVFRWWLWFVSSLILRNLKGVKRVVERTEKNLVCYFCLPLGLSLGYMYDYSGRQCKF